MIAADMRQKVYELMQQGKTKGQIVDYMVARYGHFVSYEPPLTAGTVLLWLGPGLFVLAGAGVIIARARRRDILTRRSAPKSARGWRHYCKKEKNDEPVGGYRRAAAGWRAGAAVLPVVGQRGGRPRCPQPRPVPVAPAGAGAGARRGQPGAGRRASAHAADRYPAAAAAWRTAAKPLGVVSGRAAAGGPESRPVSENQRYWRVLLWQQAERHFPALLQQVKDPTAAPLRMDELAELRLGLRSHLQDTPNDLAGWQLLGRLGLLLNDGETAIGAFGRAHALAADDPAAAFDYASALVRAGDSGQVRMGELLLRDLHQRQPNSLPVLEMLALSAVRNEDYPEAVAALQALLARLPEGDARREAIVRQLAQAQQQAQ